MAIVKVLIEGYARAQGDAIVASCTTTLIEDNGKKILVDPGINRDLLDRKLSANNLRYADIDIVFMSHYHPDHILLVALFNTSTLVDGDTVYEKDIETSYEEIIPGTSVKVIKTPGHAYEHATPLVETEKGIVAVAQDVFWWMVGKQDTSSKEALMNHKDPFAKDMGELRKSREKVLEIADWIIPGHGRMFVNKFKNTKAKS